MPGLNTPTPRTARSHQRARHPVLPKPPAGQLGPAVLTERLRQDITGHPGIRPGYAPDGWTSLVEHLHRVRVTDHEMLAAGVATTAPTRRLIDRLRDRVVFRISNDGHVLGFVGRRNPNEADDGTHGPKYLNTGETPLFHKGDQLYVVGNTKCGRAVLVEVRWTQSPSRSQPKTITSVSRR